MKKRPRAKTAEGKNGPWEKGRRKKWQMEMKAEEK